MKEIKNIKMADLMKESQVNSRWQGDL